jgi:hypothetical protein
MTVHGCKQNFLDIEKEQMFIMLFIMKINNWGAGEWGSRSSSLLLLIAMVDFLYFYLNSSAV